MKYIIILKYYTQYNIKYDSYTEIRINQQYWLVSIIMVIMEDIEKMKKSVSKFMNYYKNILKILVHISLST